MPDDALSTTYMNVGPGRSQPHMRDTIIPMDNPFGHGGKVQSLVYPAHLPDDHEHKDYAGKPKGMKVVLDERGYNVDGGRGQKRMIGDCQTCKVSWVSSHRACATDLFADLQKPQGQGG